VPETSPYKTRTTGLTTAIPDINHVSARRQSKHCRKPPYVPDDPSGEGVQLPSHLGPARAWDAGYDGRLVLDPLCEAASELFANRGTLLIVQSEFAGPRQTLATLASSGLDVEVICLAMDSLWSSVVIPRALARNDRSTRARPS
jgi:methylase of polypeptide subunit release factors